MKKNLLWRFTFFLFILVFSLVFPLKFSWGITREECESKLGKKELDLGQLKECENILNNLLQETTTQKRTIEGGIKRFNTAIAITTAKILTTIKEIENLEKEIASLTAKIGRLDLSLDQLSEILARRIAETYKKGKVDFVGLFLSSKNFSDFVSRFKYLRVVQLHDRSLMVQMETARTNFEDQKTLKEEKQE